ncbi:MAG TPA: 3-dehydroquinate synthase [Patescibacteria group bacterium]|nr:3-dehydroquinate synthase [Patescibacteria group bacterium]
MKIVKVDLKDRSYQVLIGSHVLDRAGAHIRRLGAGKDAYVITNALVYKAYGRLLHKALVCEGLSAKFKCIPDTEKSKSLKLATALLEDIARYDKKRQLCIVAFGGGVVGDVAGFVASIYKRGVPYVQAPTTLLAQVDSAIGGKTAVDLACGKNLVGAFYQPRLVICDVALLESLPAVQLASGMAEVIKYAAIKDKGLFGYLEKNLSRILDRDPGALAHVVTRCALIKARIVSVDEREEKGLRTILNFGHTIGHAIETAGGYAGHNHGQAVALGMLVACAISRQLRLLDGSAARRVESLIRKAGLPVGIGKIPLAGIINAHYHDKKFTGARNRFVLLKAIGAAVVRRDIPLGLIRQAVKGRL